MSPAINNEVAKNHKKIRQRDELSRGGQRLNSPMLQHSESSTVKRSDTPKHLKSSFVYTSTDDDSIWTFPVKQG